MTVIDQVWERVGPQTFLSRAEWERGLDGWDVKPVEIDGELAFAALTRGPEFHFIGFGTKSATARIIREHVRSVIDAHGFVVTRTPKTDARQHRFNRLIGFVADGEDEFFVHYRAERLRIGGDRKCQS